MESCETTPAQDKPPLYVPGARQSREAKRVSRGGPRRGASGGPGEYTSKTGFSMGAPVAPLAPIPGKPSPSTKSSSMSKAINNTGGYVPSAAAFNAASREVKY